MFIAHLPAGYIASKLLYPRFRHHGVGLKNFMWAGIGGALVPDVDLLYFYLLDHRQHHHHSYITHFPMLWIALVAISSAWLSWGRSKDAAALACIFSFNGLFHMFLDTIVGDIWWLAPFVDRPFAFFSVPAVHHPWWLNFILHWSFALELTFVFTATYLLLKSVKAKGETSIQE